MKQIKKALIFLLLFFPVISSANWDRSGHYRLRDTTITSQKRIHKIDENESKKRIYFEESMFGIAAGLGGGLVGGFAGVFLGSYYGVWPGAGLGYVAGNSLGIYWAGKSNNNKGSYSWILLSESIGLGVTFLSIYLWEKMYESHLSDNHYAQRIYDKMPAIAVTLSLSIPTVFGIIANEKTIKRAKR